MDDTQIRVRDRREPGHLWLDNEVIDIHAKQIGAYGLAVYSVIARKVYDRGKCSLSVREISDLIDVSASTVTKAVATLEENKLLYVERPPKGSNEPSTYYLLQVEKTCSYSEQVPTTCSPGDTGSAKPVRVAAQPVRIANANKERRSIEEEVLEEETYSSLFPEPEIINPQKKTSSKKNLTAKDYIPPEWVPREAWDAFVEMRVTIKAPLTYHACELTVRDLEKFAQAGDDPEAVLNQSVQRNWRGVFALNGGQNGKQTNLTQLPTSIARNNAAYSAAGRFIQREESARRAQSDRGGADAVGGGH